MEGSDDMVEQEKPCFILQFKLKTETWQEDIIDNRFEAGRKIFNALASKSLKRFKELKKTKTYRNLLESLNQDKKHDKPIWDEINRLRKEAGLTEYGLSSMVTPIRQHFKKQINAHIAQTLSKRLWKSFEKLLYDDGKKIHFKKYGQLNSLEGKTNTTGIIFRTESRICEWSGLKIPVMVDEDNSYEVEAFEYPIAYCRITRQFVRGKKKYYLQIVFKGEKPAKRRKSDGSFVHVLGKGDVGIDIGTSTVAWSSENSVKIIELASKAQGHEREKKLLQCKLDRSKRANNPNNYNDEDGTIKKGAKCWIRSNRYRRLALQLKEIQRKQTAVRKFQHEKLANELMQQGDTFYVEAMNFKGLQRRAKKTEKNEAGKFKRKKRFGKSLANRAPSMFLDILKRKLKYFSRALIEIDTFSARASQFNHTDETYKKKKLSERWNIINGVKVQRDMYSAFLIMNINPDLKTFNLEKCNSRFSKFLNLHNQEIRRLLGNKNLSSMGI